MAENIKIASWDVGIVNLSLCVMEKGTDANIPYHIIEWVNIDLLEEDRKTCALCNNEGKWFYNSGEECHYYCNKHRNVDDILTLSTNVGIKKYNCCYDFKNKNKQCDNDIKYTINAHEKLATKHYCGKHKPTGVCVMLPHKKIGANKMPIEILQTRLIKRLEKLESVFDVDKVVIENQPSLKAPKMKSISSTIFNYYLIRTVLDRQKYKNLKIQTVVFQSPCNKLKLDENNKLILEKTKGKHKYKMTKQLAVTYCKKLLKHDPKPLKFLNSVGKQDDFCDSFLQGCYHLDFLCKK